MEAPLNDPNRRVRREEVVYEQPVMPQGSDVRKSYSYSDDMEIESVRKGYRDANGNLMEREEQVFDDKYTRRVNAVNRTSQTIYFLAGVLLVILALRFLFRLLDASINNGLVNFIYDFSAPFVAPFSGIFNDQGLTQGSLLEISTLLAIGIYALLAYGIVKLIQVLFTPSRSSREVFTTTRRHN